MKTDVPVAKRVNTTQQNIDAFQSKKNTHLSSIVPALLVTDHAPQNVFATIAIIQKVPDKLSHYHHAKGDDKSTMATNIPEKLFVCT